MLTSYWTSCKLRLMLYTTALITTLKSLSFWKVVLFGQSLSILITGMSICSRMLENSYDISCPTAQSFLNYVMLCGVYAPIFACKRYPEGGSVFISVIRTKAWKYAILALVDVEANYLIVKSYQYTTITSIQLLDCFTIPVVFLLSFLILHMRFNMPHYSGVLMCIGGTGMLIVADYLTGSDAAGSNRLLGDILCICGAALYGISNVGEEYVVKNFSRIEFLAMIGIFGSVFSGIQLSALEHNEISELKFSAGVITLLITYTVLLFIFYSCMPLVLQYSSAASVNLSILTADFYTLLISLFVFKDLFNPLYIVAFIFIVLGIILYSSSPVHVRTVEERKPGTAKAVRRNSVNNDMETGDALEWDPQSEDFGVDGVLTIQGFENNVLDDGWTNRLLDDDRV